jgi:hypothetical protein
MIALVAYAALFWASLRRLIARNPSHLAVCRAATLCIAAPAVILSVLARLGAGGHEGLTAAVLAGSVLVALWAARSRTGSSNHGTWELIGLALAAAVVMPRSDIGPVAVARDGMAHLAWSKDLISASTFYAPGLPAFLSTFTLGDPLVGAFRVAPLVLLCALFMQMISLGRAFGWARAGLGGCIALLSMPALTGRLEPALPEMMAYVLIVAMWVELRALGRGHREAAYWLAFLSFSLALTHVSILEVVHFAVLGLTLFLQFQRPLRDRLMAVTGLIIGGALAIMITPVLGAILFGDGILLMREQPSNLAPFSVRGLAVGWGLGFDVALLGAFLLVTSAGKGVRRVVGSAVPFYFAALLLVSPMLLKWIGMDLPLQVFSSRLISAASVFTVIGWVVMLAQLRERRARWAGVVALFPLLAVLDRFSGAPLFLAMAVLGAVAAVFVIRCSSAGARWRGVVLAAVLVLSLVGRLIAWNPTDPDWVIALRAVEPEDKILLTHWPSFNQAQARTGLAVEVGIAGADAGLPLHALTGLPSLRGQLQWAEDSTEADRDALVEWICGRGEEEVLVLVHREIEGAWAGYRKIWERRQEGDLGPGALVYRRKPCPDPASTRVARMQSVLGSLETAHVFYEDESATIYRVSPQQLRSTSSHRPQAAD